MSLEFGAIRSDMEREHRDMIEKIIAAKRDLDEYYILVHTNTHGTHDIFSKFITTNERPPTLIGTICYHVNNEEGKLTRKWCLPFDIELPEGVMDDKAEEGIAKDAKDFKEWKI
jgi:hypothetical protein